MELRTPASVLGFLMMVPKFSGANVLPSAHPLFAAGKVGLDVLVMADVI